MVQICIGMVLIPLKWFECGFESFKSLLNGSNLHLKTSKSSKLDLKALNPFRMFRMWFRKLRIPFEWFEFAFENFESLSNSSNLHSKTSNHIRMVRMLF